MFELLQARASPSKPRACTLTAQVTSPFAPQLAPALDATLAGRQGRLVQGQEGKRQGGPVSLPYCPPSVPSLSPACPAAHWHTQTHGLRTVPPQLPLELRQGDQGGVVQGLRPREPTGAATIPPTPPPILLSVPPLFSASHF